MDCLSCRKCCSTCGKRFRVLWSAHKTADTIELYSIRRMANAVHLEELRCNGAAHGGCQAECLLFWSESWLKRLPVEAIRPEISSNATVEDGCAPQNVSSLSRGTRRQVADGKAERYRCQATEMLNASSEVRRRDRWDPRFYLKDVTSGNVTLINFILFGALAMLNAFLKQWFGVRYSGIRGLVVGKTPTLTLNLQPGELVSVRRKEDIERTLDGQLRNRGMWFDEGEMTPYCGKGNFRVRRRVEQIINEKTGEMMRLTNPCITLDGVTCSGNYLPQRMFSRRHDYMYFREIWLRRVEAHRGEPVAESSQMTEREN